MGLKLVLDDHDIDALEEATGKDFSQLREAVAKESFTAIRSWTIETACRVLHREPGGIMELTDEEPPELDDVQEMDTVGHKCSWKTHAAIVAVSIVVACAVISGIAFRAW